MRPKGLSRAMSRGFTLIELLITVAIIGVLASIVLVSLSGARGKSRDAKRLAELQQMARAIALADTGIAVAFLPTGAGTCGGTANADASTCTAPDLTKFKDPAGVTNPCGPNPTDKCQYSIATTNGAAGPTTQNWKIKTYLEVGTSGIPTKMCISSATSTPYNGAGCNP